MAFETNVLNKQILYSIEVKRNSSLQPDRARQLDYTVSRLLSSYVSFKTSLSPICNTYVDIDIDIKVDRGTHP